MSHTTRESEVTIVGPIELDQAAAARSNNNPAVVFLSVPRRHPFPVEPITITEPLSLVDVPTVPRHCACASQRWASTLEKGKEPRPERHHQESVAMQAARFFNRNTHQSPPSQEGAPRCARLVGLGSCVPTRFASGFSRAAFLQERTDNQLQQF